MVRGSDNDKEGFWKVYKDSLVGEGRSNEGQRIQQQDEEQLQTGQT